MNVKQRLSEYIKFKKISKSDFCRSIEVSNAYISSIVTSIQPDKIQRITLNYPDLNIGWLLTGLGTMLILDQLNSVTHNICAKEVLDNDTSKLLIIIENKDKEINELHRQNGKLEGKIEYLEDELKKRRELDAEYAYIQDIANVG